MFPSTSSHSRYLRAARRSRLARVVALGAITMVPVACGNGDAETFNSASTVAESVPATDTASPVVTDAPTTTALATVPATVTATDPTTIPATIPATAPATATFPAGAEVVVDFTYSASSGGQVENPYIAVWVEDTDGNLVQTISLWYEQTGKGPRYLNDLRGWASASGGTVDTTTSGATRTAGSYSVAWDGTDIGGAPVAQGDYVLFVEAAREHGPYEITSTPITIADTGFSVALADNGELSNLSATLTA